jgi:hypothetical protein
MESLVGAHLVQAERNEPSADLSPFSDHALYSAHQPVAASSRGSGPMEHREAQGPTSLGPRTPKAAPLVTGTSRECADGPSQGPYGGLASPWRLPALHLPPCAGTEKGTQTRPRRKERGRRPAPEAGCNENQVRKPPCTISDGSATTSPNLSDG